ncbi:MAG: deoxyribose-phosphate aldolase [Gammaproteobacteria bacterium]|nr:deoxyribose-phosphate aldolase [Gammaproteobacteria bacterium]
MDVKHLADVIGLIDLTSLNPDDNDTVIKDLCAQAQTKLGNVAAVCVYLPFVKTAHHALSHTAIHLATVVNFPDGDQPMATILKDIAQGLKAGADEIDVVIPYQQLKKGELDLVRDFVAECKTACGAFPLKVILETGELTPQQILQASRNAISGGADFLKTSTGKVAVNATLNATEIMLRAIKDSGKPVGLKVSGGVRTLEQAEQYIKQAVSIMGKDFINAKTFRFGASSLLNNLLNQSHDSTSGY